MPVWKDFEEQVRMVASYIWLCEAKPEMVNGVYMDCVLKPEPNRWILVEISTEKTLDKVRTDINKLAGCRFKLFGQNIFSQCFLVIPEPPTANMYETGQGDYVEVLSIDQFKGKFFDFKSYSYSRLQQTFGSAVDPVSGETDTRKYVPINYRNRSTGQLLQLPEIATLLKNNTNIILLGKYGTGKSRCLKELFQLLSSNANNDLVYPICINLRHNWGIKRGYEAIRRHFDDLGFSDLANNVLRALPSGSICLLLDGFDEIGSQSWSNDPTKLLSSRLDSLQGIRDLIRNSPGGLLIAGREHYFNSDDEMFHCLGLKRASTIVLECPDEFSESEMQQYLAEISPDLFVPTWLPKRPLICQVISGLAPDVVERLLTEPEGILGFWKIMMDSICERETRIHTSLDANSIREVLKRIARLTRSKAHNVGPITITEIYQAFEDAVKTPPVDESLIMLHRLPALGRVGSESEDRQFIDMYILDGLRAEDTIEIVIMHDVPVRNESWSNPLEEVGLSIVAEHIYNDGNITQYKSTLTQLTGQPNQYLAGDILAAMLYKEHGAAKALDYKGVWVVGAEIKYLDLSNCTASNLMLDSCIIWDLDITNAHPKDLKISNSEVIKLIGVPSEKGLPEWIKNVRVASYETIDNTARIRKANRSSAHRVFVTIIKKTFFQPGAGRKEEALLRGLGKTGDSTLASKILNLLLQKDILKKIKGNEGWVYVPIRKYTHQMEQVLAELTLSNDPLWKEIGLL